MQEYIITIYNIFLHIYLNAHHMVSWFYWLVGVYIACRSFPLCSFKWTLMLALNLTIYNLS